MHGQMVQNPCLEAISLLIQGSLMMQMEKLTEAEKVVFLSISVCLSVCQRYFAIDKEL